ncbi:MAG: TadE/TadG family type IV pilus assembly protein [Acidobacteriaceae bacterium]
MLTLQLRARHPCPAYLWWSKRAGLIILVVEGIEDHMWTRNLRNDRGGSLVELALALPLLCLLLIGSVELGRMAYASIEVSNAARAAVAYGSQNPTTAALSADMATAATLDAADLTSMGATLATNATEACVCDNVDSSGNVTSTPITVCAGPASTALIQCPLVAASGTNTIVHYVQATTSATVNTIFNYPGIPTSFTLHGYAQMRVLQ